MIALVGWTIAAFLGGAMSALFLVARAYEPCCICNKLHRDDDHWRKVHPTREAA